MSTDRELEDLIDRLISGDEPAGNKADVGAVPPASERPSLRVLRHVFAAYSSLRHGSADAATEQARGSETPRAVGHRIGVFRLLRPIGSGGMGEVWLAERSDGTVDQRVAIKFLRRAHDREVELFAREQQLLARLVHPCIARFLDAGRDAGGVPYLIMEYVDGMPIDNYCERNGLDLHERLALFLRVCDAVEYAHRQFVVHRDIKPGNVLVDGEGLPRLLDFGLAKLLEATPPLVETRTLAPAVTLAYAAPEQFRGDPASTSTDVFSLGLLLYDVLAGRLPPSRSQANLATLALGGEIEGLSATAASSAKGVDPRLLAGDLDVIVAKATQPEPGERYGSVVEFADDLRRHLAGRPVRAHVPTRGYRLRKFVRRHRIGVIASTLAIVALVAGFATAVWQAGIAREQARRAELQTARAARVADFMTGLFREQDPFSRNSAQARSAQELVAEGVTRAHAELGSEPALLSSMLGVLGEATMNLGDVEGGRVLLEEARTLVDAETMAAARLDGLLGNIAIRQGRAAAGVEAIGEAVARLRGGSQADRVAAAKLDIRRAFALFTLGKTNEALAMLEKSHAELVSVLGPDHGDAIEMQSGILSVLGQMRRDDEAEILAKRLVARIERVFGADSPRLPDVFSEWALVEKRRGRYDAALGLFDRAIAISRHHQGGVNEMLASLYSRKANAYQDSGRSEEAIAALDQAEQALPPGADRERAQILATRGETFIDLGRADEAEAALHEALLLRRASAGDGDGLVWYSQSEWGRALNAQGRHDEAKKVQLEALARMEAIMGAEAYQLTFVLGRLAETYEADGDPVSAVPLYRRCVALAGKKYPRTNPIVAQFSAALASALRQAGEVDAAISQADAILADREDHPELGHSLARAALVKANALHGRGQHEAAIALARQGLADLDRGVDNAVTRRELVALIDGR